MVPVPPPTRPHSAAPAIALKPSVFPQPSSSRPTSYRGLSTSSFSIPREAEWEDAWDSSSDKEDTAHPSPRAIPISNKSSKNDSGSNVAASWASTSYHHVSTPSPPLRPGFIGAKTYSDGTNPPAPGTLNGGGFGGAKLPPGGAWEIVESSEIREEEEVDLVKVGKEAVRVDVEDILNGETILYTFREEL